MLERDETLSRNNRLHKSSDFKRVFSRGKRTAASFFVIYCLPNRLPSSRIGIQVKAKLGTAVRRNYMKRIVREVFRRLKNDFREPLDIIVIAGPGMADLRYQQLDREMKKALGKYFKEHRT